MKNISLKQSTIIVVLVVFVLSLVAFGSTLSFVATAQEGRSFESLGGGPELVIVAGGAGNPGARGLAQTFTQEYLLTAPETAVINVNYIGTWPGPAQTAFQHAVDIWETLITSAVPVEVNARFFDLGNPNILGSAGAEDYVINVPGGVSNTWYPNALANKINGSDFDGAEHDINANFNSTFPNWYFGTDGNPAGNQYDFVTVVLHELMHGLGFSGSMTVGPPACSSGAGCWGSGTAFPFIYDRFTENGSGTTLLSFTNNTPALAAQLTGGDIFFNGANTNAANGTIPAELYAPSPWNQGSSYSHLDEGFNSTPNALMTFSLSLGEVQHLPGPVALGIFQDMGWTTSGIVYDEFVYLPITRKSLNTVLQVQDGGFEDGTPNTYWTEFSSTFGSPICLVAVCGSGSGTGPHSGTYWVWFGGTNPGLSETGYVHQDVMFPGVPSNLTFWLEIPVTNTTGFMQVSIDGTPIFTVMETDGPTYATYTQVVLDVSAYSDGGVHNLRFDSTTDAGAGALNIFVDDVEIVAQ